MKCLRLTKRKCLEIADIDRPKPNGLDAIIKVRSSGICGSDLHFWSEGLGADAVNGLIMGHEFCGVAEDPGAGKQFKLGDRVTGIPLNPCGKCYACEQGFVQLCLNNANWEIMGITGPGAYAEYVSLRSDFVVKLPDNISDPEAALIEPSAICLHAVNSGNVKPNDRVLIVGAGPIGVMCAAWARIKGASYIAMTELNDKRAENALKLGDVDEVFNPADPKIVSKLKRSANGGVHVAIDTSASEAGINMALRSILPKGTLVLVGISMSPQSLQTITGTMKEIVIRPVLGYLPDEFIGVMDAMSCGLLKAEHFIGRTIRLPETQSAFEELSSGTSGDLKIIIRFQ
ncbi:MAG TPA: alcohol dehydrogenase catalytic domain-containing protein [Smithella sp.]|nr:alcohol dehydrogenase catalytic domain-containing protein [Smithella sp.]